MAKEKTCPLCGSSRVIPIIYGYPSMEMWAQENQGEIELGGCCIGDNDPEFRCKDCGHAWLEGPPVNSTDVNVMVKSARMQYKPVKLKYLLVGEAPPESIDRFFYYPDVKRADHLFLGIMGVLYPELKQRYLLNCRPSGLKETILRRFQEDGFYLLDILDIPLALQRDLKIIRPYLRPTTNHDNQLFLG